MTDLEALQRAYRDIGAPASTAAVALTTYGAGRHRRPLLQPALVAAAALVLAVVAVPAFFDRDGPAPNGFSLPARDFAIPSLSAIDLPRPESVTIARPSALIQTPSLTPTSANEIRNEV